mgnify:CR=1 FL=1
MIRFWFIVAVLWPMGGGAQTLSFPGNADMTAQDDVGLSSYAMPVGSWDDGNVPTMEYEGNLTRQSWRIDASGITTLQLLRPLREQLRNDGYEITFACETDVCGGFDFRFAIDVFPAPDMHVDLFDYRYVAARKPSDGGPIYVAALISRTNATGFLQLSQVAPKSIGHFKVETNGPRVTATVKTQIPVAGADLPLDASINARGHAILDDLVFETGSSSLGKGPFTSLVDLAAYLQADETRRVALVGHTDSEGSLSGNIALSKRRAASVVERLVSAYNIPRSQLAAEGMGYLAPIANNQTPEGRIQNRRVEVILLNTE